MATAPFVGQLNSFVARKILPGFGVKNTVITNRPSWKGLGQVTSGQAAAQASPAAVGVLPYAQWAADTAASYPGSNAVEIAAATTQDAYNQYLAIHNVTQQERAQGGGPALDAVLSSMSATPDWYAAAQSAPAASQSAPAAAAVSSAVPAAAAPPVPSSPTAAGDAIDMTGTPASTAAPAVATTAVTTTSTTGFSTTELVVGGLVLAALAYWAFGTK